MLCMLVNIAASVGVAMTFIIVGMAMAFNINGVRVPVAFIFVLRELRSMVVTKRQILDFFNFLDDRRLPLLRRLAQIVLHFFDLFFQLRNFLPEPLIVAIETTYFLFINCPLGFKIAIKSLFLQS